MESMNDTIDFTMDTHGDTYAALMRTLDQNGKFFDAMSAVPGFEATRFTMAIDGREFDLGIVQVGDGFVGYYETAPVQPKTRRHYVRPDDGNEFASRSDALMAVGAAIWALVPDPASEAQA